VEVVLSNQEQDQPETGARSQAGMIQIIFIGKDIRMFRAIVWRMADGKLGMGDGDDNKVSFDMA
jgi:hypothetical protein